MVLATNLIIFGGKVPTGWVVFFWLVALVAFVLVAGGVEAWKGLVLIGVGLAAFVAPFLWAAIAAS